MSQEILYTSATAGLKRGSHGFCTVVSTAGMAQNLAQQLEMLSGYRHAFPLNDPRAALNPVNYSHLILPLAGRRYHVLSRIADAGVDYTQRSNKLAHHVALEESERVAAGPAAVLATPGFCECNWDGTARILPAGRTPSNRPESTGPCVEWKAVTGDAGWAGVVANHLISEREKPISVIFPAGTDTLHLTDEILRLIPEGRRWEITFSTYFTKLPAGLQCQLRFVLDGTPEATALRRHPHVAVLDLCTDLGPAETNGLVEIARVGRSSLPRPTQRVPGSPPPELDTASALEMPAVARAYIIAPPPRPTKRRRSGKELKAERPAPSPGSKRIRRTILLVLIPLLVTFTLSIGGIFLYRHLSAGSSETTGAGESSSTKRESHGFFGLTAADNKTSPATARKSSAPSANLPKTRPNAGNPADPIVHKTPPPDKSIKKLPAPKSQSSVANKGAGMPPKIAVTKPPPRPPSGEITKPHAPKVLRESLDLPAAPSAGLAGGPPQTAGPKVLRSVPNGSELTLTLIPPSKTERDLLKGASFEVRPDGKGVSRWNVFLKKVTSGDVTRFDRPVGRFTLEKNQLMFGWEPHASEHFEDQLFRFRRLRLSLRLKSSTVDVTNDLTAPVTAKPLSLAALESTSTASATPDRLHKKGISGRLLARMKNQLYCDAWISFPVTVHKTALRA